MKVFEKIANAISKVWKFCSTVVTISLVSVFVLLGIAFFLPENAVKVIEIIQGLLS